MIEVIRHHRDKYMKLKLALKNLQQELCERFWNFETFYSWTVRIPFGAMLIYCAIGNLKLGYQIALGGAGVALLISGLRNGTMNPIKYWNKVEELQERRKTREY